MQGLRSSRCALGLFAFLNLTVPAGCGSSGGGGSDGSDNLPACSLGSSMADIEKNLFRGPKCSVCHVLTPSGQHPLYPTNLDLGSPGLAARMVDKMSESDPNKGKCPGRILVPKADPTNGLFVQKVMAMPPCGDRMPQGMPALSDDEISCVKRWAILAAQSVP